jgi:lipopolysaccharide transport system ATP-binding protein
MSEIALRVDELSKRFQIAHFEQYKTLREAITRAVAAPWRNLKKALNSSCDTTSESFWALKNVSFEVKRGEVLGVIGRNGAGKSTLLKVLSRITEPTEGVARIRGRVGSLLEVGTGFHPELSGRENIYLNGAILGMRKAEIDKKFDEIVAFSEVERFIDTPVKYYSSGMYMRLAFSIAAHLESEILIVDEVLAVGDAAFQKKCMGKMNDVATCGRTILFVSHNLNAVEQLCTAGLLLEKGKVKLHSNDVRSVTRAYLMAQDEGCDGSEWVAPVEVRRRPRWLSLSRCTITDEYGVKKLMPLSNDSDCWLTIEADVAQTDPGLIVGYVVYAEDGTVVYRSDHTDGPENEWPALRPGHCIFRTRLPRHFLNEGTYRIEVMASVPNEWIYESGRNSPALFINIKGGLSRSPNWMARRAGITAPIMEWSVNY